MEKAEEKKQQKEKLNKEEKVLSMEQLSELSGGFTPIQKSETAGPLGHPLRPHKK